MEIIKYFMKMVEVLFSTAESYDGIRPALLLLFFFGFLCGVISVLLISALFRFISKKRS